MFLAMTLLARDEQEILRDNIRYHLDLGVDHIVVTDNRSEDRTRAIVEDYVRQGVATYIYEPADIHAQSRWVTRMARLAHERLGAKWILHTDADEFWMPRHAASLSEFFRGVEGYNVVQGERHDFVCFHEEDNGGMPAPFWRRMVYRKKVSLNPLGQPLLPKVAHLASAGVVVEHGNHAVSGLADTKILQGGLDILHFPLRSRQQYLRKIRVGGRAFENNRELPEEVGITWRRQYRELLETGTLKFVDESIVSRERLRDMIASGHAIEDLRLKIALSATRNA